MAVSIHQEKALIEEVNSREQMYLQLIHSVLDPVVTLDAVDGTIVAINPATERIFQYLPSELVGKSFNVLVSDSFTNGGPAGAVAEYAQFDSSSRAQFSPISTETLFANRRDGSKVPVTVYFGQTMSSGKK